MVSACRSSDTNFKQGLWIKCGRVVRPHESCLVVTGNFLWRLFCPITEDRFHSFRRHTSVQKSPRGVCANCSSTCRHVATRDPLYRRALRLTVLYRANLLRTQARERKRPEENFTASRNMHDTPTRLSSTNGHCDKKCSNYFQNGSTSW